MLKVSLFGHNSYLLALELAVYHLKCRQRCAREVPNVITCGADSSDLLLVTCKYLIFLLYLVIMNN